MSRDFSSTAVRQYNYYITKCISGWLTLVQDVIVFDTSEPHHRKQKCQWYSKLTPVPSPLKHTLTTCQSIRNFQSEADVSRFIWYQVRVIFSTVTCPSVLTVDHQRILIQAILGHNTVHVIIRTNFEFKIAVDGRQDLYPHRYKTVGREVGSSNYAKSILSSSLIRAWHRHIPWIPTDTTAPVILCLSLYRRRK